MVCALVTVSLSLAFDPRLAEARPERFISARGSGPMARVFRLLKEEMYIRNGLFGGKVIALSEDTITVRWQSDFPRTFAVSPPIASKDIPLNRKFGGAHRLGDVRIGDTVGLHLVPTARGYVVIAVGIARRPGGTIPPAEDSDLPEHNRMHHYFNARQKVEEKVLPKLPHMFLHFHP